MVSSDSDSISHLQKDGVIPDVISLSSLFYTLKIEWPTATLGTPGATLGHQVTQAQPRIFISPIISGFFYRPGLNHEFELECILCTHVRHVFTQWMFKKALIKVKDPTTNND